MIKSLLSTIIKNAKYALFAGCILFPQADVFIPPAPAEFTTTNTSISFPIAELGYCSTLNSCREYCDDPVHHDVCTAFAETKQLPTEARQIPATFMQAAQDSFGCDNALECKQFCQKEQNRQKCIELASEHGVETSYASKSSTAIMQKASIYLGCTSYESCKTYCDKESNKDACQAFSEHTGLRGGTTTIGPGNCTSSDNCQAFCSLPENVDICSDYAISTHGPIIGSEYSGPGGCTDKQTCRVYCDKNPDACGMQSFVDNQQGQNNKNKSNETADSWCKVSSDGIRSICKDTEGVHYDRCEGTTSTKYKCGGDWDGANWVNIRCKQYQFSCSYGYTCYQNSCQLPSSVIKQRNENTVSPRGEVNHTEIIDRVDDDYVPTRVPDYNDFDEHEDCPSGAFWNGSRCIPYPTPTRTRTYTVPTSTPVPIQIIHPTQSPEYDPEDQCEQQPNCEWENNACRCYDTSTTSADNDYHDQCVANGCTWTGSDCDCYDDEPYDPPTNAEEQCIQSGCTWSGTSCVCGVFDNSSTDLEYPVKKLGNCNSCGECQNFCSQENNNEVCITYASENGLLQNHTEHTIHLYEQAASELGCTSEESCRALCSLSESSASCSAFAAKSGISDHIAITTPTNNSTISGISPLTVHAPENTSVSLYLIPSNTNGSSLYVRQIRVDQDSAQDSFDTSIFPNGQYKLIAKTEYGSDQAISPVSLTIQNTPTEKHTLPALEALVFPDTFMPEKTVVDSTLKVSDVTFDYEVQDKATNKADTILTGTAEPNSIVTLLIYSDPTVVTVRADENGVWTYTLDKPLETGEHTAYVAVTKSNGETVRSDAVSFVVPQAFAADSTDEIPTQETSSSIKPLTLFMVVVVIVIVIANLLLFLMFRLKSKSSSVDI